METDLDLEEKQLLCRLRGGDHVAFEELYHRYKVRILQNIRKLVRDPEIAAELHQDIFLKLWQYRTRIDIERPIVAYLVTIAKNVAIDFYQKAAREKQLQVRLMQTMATYHEELMESIDFKETKEILETIITKLPPQRRQVYRLIKLEQKTYEEAALHFGVSVGTIKDHMAKANRFIQINFAEHNPGLLICALSIAMIA